MKLLPLLALVFAAIQIPNARAQDAQSTPASSAPNPAPNPDATLNYIHAAWDSLTRSVTG